MSRLKKRAQRGVTLIELMVTLGLMVILVYAVSYGFVGAMDIQRAQSNRQKAQIQLSGVERRIGSFIEGAWLSANAQDTGTYFVGTQDGGGSSGGSELGCDQLVFTTLAPTVPLAVQQSQDDFETQHRNYGPQGGIAEVSLSTFAMGNAGNRTGIFERVQRPADGDPTQGGMESLLSAQIDQIGFQFWDGTQWESSWDTLNQTRRLPQSVKVSYHIQNAPSQEIHVLVVPIPQSDVDSTNPVTNATGSTAGQ